MKCVPIYIRSKRMVRSWGRAISGSQGQRKFGNPMSPEGQGSEASVTDDPAGESALQREKRTRGLLTQTGVLSNIGETEEEDKQI